MDKLEEILFAAGAFLRDIFIYFIPAVPFTIAYIFILANILNLEPAEIIKKFEFIDILIFRVVVYKFIITIFF